MPSRSNGRRRARGALRSLWIVWYAIVINLVWGVLLLLDQAAADDTPVHAIYLLLHERYLLGVVLITVACLALVSLFLPRGPGLALILILPQQITLTASSIGALRAMWQGMYADGVARPHVFIIADQAPIVLLAIFHMVAIVYQYGYRANR